MDSLSESLKYFAPEVILVLFGAMTLLGDLLLPKYESSKTSFTAFVGVVTAMVATCMLMGHLTKDGDASVRIFSGMLVVDPFSLFFKLLALGSAALVLFFAPDSREFHNRRMGEFFAILMFAAVGMCMMVSAANLLMIYLAIETMSICSYVLTGYMRNERSSVEAGVKYLIFGGVSSAVMLFGISILYGLTGTFDLPEIARMLGAHRVFDEKTQTIILQNGYAIWMSLAMVGAGFAYKISAAPFHFWTPDVYQGAPISTAAFLATASKAAAIAAVIRFAWLMAPVMTQPLEVQFGHPGTDHTGQAWPAYQHVWSTVLMILAVLTMFIGNLAAIRQTDVKRMLAFSSIAHAGYMLIGIAVAVDDQADYGKVTAGTASVAGFTAVMFYMIPYVFMTLGSFLVVQVVHNRTGSSQLEAFRGIGWKAPVLGVPFVIFLVSLAGLPPTAGFIGKLYLFYAALDQGFLWLVVLGLINSVISVYYYYRIVKAMFLEKPEDESQVHALPIHGALLGAFAVPLILLGLYWMPVKNFADKALSLW